MRLCRPEVRAALAHPAAPCHGQCSRPGQCWLRLCSPAVSGTLLPWLCVRAREASEGVSWDCRPQTVHSLAPEMQQRVKNRGVLFVDAYDPVWFCMKICLVCFGATTALSSFCYV